MESSSSGCVGAEVVNPSNRMGHGHPQTRPKLCTSSKCSRPRPGTPDPCPRFFCPLLRPPCQLYGWHVTRQIMEAIVTFQASKVSRWRRD